MENGTNPLIKEYRRGEDMIIIIDKIDIIDIMGFWNAYSQLSLIMHVILQNSMKKAIPEHPSLYNS